MHWKDRLGHSVAFLGVVTQLEEYKEKNLWEISV